MNLIHNTTSLCPECQRILPAKIIEEDAAVWMVKECPVHNSFREKISILPDLYKKRIRWTGPLLTSQGDFIPTNCPKLCEKGLCKWHQGQAYNVFIDVTNRCNLNCPVCFVNIPEKFIPIDPPIEEIKEILTHWKRKKITLHLIGGEPTLRKDLPLILQFAKKECGISDIQVCTNGVKLADYDYMRLLFNSGMKYVFLSMDGLTEETYQIMKGNPRLLEYKFKVIENVKKTGTTNRPLIFSITATKHNLYKEIPMIIKLAKENYRYIRMIIVLTESFCGKNIPRDTRSKRITDSHVMKMLLDSMGEEGRAIPLSVLSYGAELFKMIHPRMRTFSFPQHPECDIWVAWLYNSREKKLTNFLSFFNCDVDEIYWRFRHIYERTYSLNKSRKKRAGKARFFLSDYFIKIFVLLNVSLFLFKKLKNKFQMMSYFQNTILYSLCNIWRLSTMSLKDLLRRARRKCFPYSESLILQIVPFSDLYNIDNQKCIYCTTFYSLVHPETKKVVDIPFCANNNLYRDIIEKKQQQARNE